MVVVAAVVVASCSSGGAVHVAASSTSSTLPPTTSTAPTTTLPPTTAKATVLAAKVQLGSIFGSIDAGAGGKGSADLQDDHGHRWHRDADANGAYRFDGLAPGHYVLTLGASSAPPPCSPQGTCLGPASHFTRQDIQLAAGENHRADLGS